MKRPSCDTCGDEKHIVTLTAGDDTGLLLMPPREAWPKLRDLRGWANDDFQWRMLCLKKATGFVIHRDRGAAWGAHMERARKLVNGIARTAPCPDCVHPTVVQESAA